MTDTAELLIAMERAALDRWARGDPGGFLEISDSNVSYFDPFVEARLDGHAALAQMYENIRGQVQLDRFELVNPRVQEESGCAVLSFQFRSWTGGVENQAWNTTEVYARRGNEWRLIHAHWAYRKP